MIQLGSDRCRRKDPRNIPKTSECREFRQSEMARQTIQIEKIITHPKFGKAIPTVGLFNGTSSILLSFMSHK